MLGQAFVPSSEALSAMARSVSRSLPATGEWFHTQVITATLTEPRWRACRQALLGGQERTASG